MTMNTKVTIKPGEYVRVTTGHHTRWYYYLD